MKSCSFYSYSIKNEWQKERHFHVIYEDTFVNTIHYYYIFLYKCETGHVKPLVCFSFLSLDDTMAGTKYILERAFRSIRGTSYMYIYRPLFQHAIHIIMEKSIMVEATSVNNYGCYFDCDREVLQWKIDINLMLLLSFCIGLQSSFCL